MYDNMPNNTYTPVTRNNMFYSKEDFDLEMELVEGYIEEDLNQTVVVYQVDRKATQVNDIYKEANTDIRFLPPVEVPCMYEIQDQELKSYESKTQTGVYSVNGNLKLYINLLSFKKYDFDIKRGDYIGVLIEENRMNYWVVTNDGKVNTANQLVLGGYKTGFRVIDCAPTNDLEIRGL